jgi:CxxC motif-containing protein (DUF1111 family)
MSCLAQHTHAQRYVKPAVVTALMLVVMGCADANPATPDTPTHAQLADSSITSFNALVRHAPNPESDALSGGDNTVFDTTDLAFGHADPNLSASELALHDTGDDAFAQVFTTQTGAGPHLNNPSCEGCHLGDGRGELPAPGTALVSMLLRISVPGVASDGGPAPVPSFGAQLQPIGVAPIPREADVSVSYTYTDGHYGNGERFELRRPLFQILNPHVPLPASLLVSPRVAPPNFGLGLLEAVPAHEIAALADEDDQNGDGISGRMNMVYDVIEHRPSLGRFGAKANNPSLRQQTAGAFNGDMGVTTSVFPAESCEGVFTTCARHRPEISDDMLKAVTFYVQTLAVPARRNINDPRVRLGQALFAVIGCGGCHVHTLRTGELAGVPSASHQVIHPYTDLLLHDMGRGLADDRPDFLATGREFRTAPLWGVGLTTVVNPKASFLHDGRARNVAEAILWHGGEAHTSREVFRRLPHRLREALLAFVGSL